MPDNWASEATTTLGCSITISRDIYKSVCMLGENNTKNRMLKCVGGIT